jgi:hypothetical protein
MLRLEIGNGSPAGVVENGVNLRAALRRHGLLTVVTPIYAVFGRKRDQGLGRFRALLAARIKRVIEDGIPPKTHSDGRG